MTDSAAPILSADHIWSPKMRAFGALWAVKRGGDPVLARDRFRPEEWGRWWSNMMLYSVEPDPEGKRPRNFRMTYQGDELEYTDGGSKIGKRIEEIAPARPGGAHAGGL